MRLAGLLFGFLALSFVLLPALTAQEKDKKADAKADKDANDEKKDPPKKEKKVEEKKEEKFEHGPVIKTKILSMKPDSARDLTVEIQMPDQQAMYNLQMWQAQQMASIQQSRNPQEYQQRMYAFQMAMAQKQAQGAGYAMKPVEVRAAENCKVRMMNPPVQYDDAGNLKKWTKKELTDLKAKSKLPGFPADFDNLKGGQYIEIYMAKQHGSPKDKWGATKKKKDEDAPEMATVPEVVMIVIWAEPVGR